MTSPAHLSKWRDRAVVLTAGAAAGAFDHRPTERYGGFLTVMSGRGWRVSRWTDAERAALATLVDELIPGAAALGAVDYLEQLLTALDHDPPRLWAGGDGWIEPGPWERHAWRHRLDAWRAAYDRLLAGNGTDADRRVAYEHACEACYGDPAYGGNRDGAGWAAIGFPKPDYPPFFVGSAAYDAIQSTKNAPS